MKNFDLPRQTNFETFAKYRSDEISPSERELLDRLEPRVPTSVVVASASEIKINAVREALVKLFPGRAFTIEGVKAVSEINEQPVGSRETFQGAYNRLRNALRLKNEQLEDGLTKPNSSHVYVAVENGIVKPNREEPYWWDQAVAGVVLPGMTIALTRSHPKYDVNLPDEAVFAAQSKPEGFKENTVGKEVANMFETAGKKIDHQDPHSALTNGKVTRMMQMVDAIRGAFESAADPQPEFGPGEHDRF